MSRNSSSTRSGAFSPENPQYRKRLCLCAAALGATAAASVAAFAATNVAIRVEGFIPQECAIGSASGAGTYGMDVAIKDITRPGQRDYAFVVNCNAPFGYRLEARHGALTNDDGSVAPAGFIASVPYDVAILIPTDISTIRDNCTGASIRAGQVNCPFSDSGNGIALGREAKLTVAWRPRGVPVAGRYTDRLAITLGARQ
jgi:hypothetical protein